MIVAFTGHRPDKLGGYRSPNPICDWVSWCIHEELDRLNPTKAISGMAQGVDQWAATICINRNLPFIAAIPFVGQESMWPEAAQKRWRFLLGKAYETVVVCKGGYSPAKMQKRNEWMVDHADVLIAVWDGTPGGTGNCVRYAEKKNKRIVRIKP